MYGMTFLADEDMNASVQVHWWLQNQPEESCAKLTSWIDSYFSCGLK